MCFLPWMVGYNSWHSKYLLDVPLILPPLPWLSLYFHCFSWAVVVVPRQPTFTSSSLMNSGVSLQNCPSFHHSICICMTTLQLIRSFQHYISFCRIVFKTLQFEPDSTSVIFYSPCPHLTTCELTLTSLAFAYVDPDSSHLIPLALSPHLPIGSFLSCGSCHHMSDCEGGL